MLEVIKLFVRRMFMGKGKGILQIPPQNKVDDFANDLFKKFKQNGVPDEAVTNPNDVKAIWNQITNRETQILSTNLKDVLQKPDPFKKAGEVFDLKGKKIKNPQNIMGGEEIIETEAQILARLNKGNKESLSNMRYEKAVKAEEAKAAADEDYIMKILDPEDFAQGGRAGLYRGGQAMIEPDLSDIGHGSDALMARNALLTPGSQATTSTGLNYLLGEDNDTTRVPYAHGNGVADEDAEKAALGKRVRELMDEGFDMGEAVKKAMKEGYADGGRIGFSKGKGVDLLRRGFLKTMGAAGAGIAAAKSGLFSLLKGGGEKQVIKELTSVPIGNPEGMPVWFKPLVNKIIKEGDDVTKKFGTVDRELVHTKKIDKFEEVTVYQDLNTGNVRMEYGPHLTDDTGKVIRASNEPTVVQLEYKAPEVIEPNLTTGKGGRKTKEEFYAAESEPEIVNWDGDIEMSGINEVNKVDDLITDTSKLQKYATDNKLTIKELSDSMKKQKYKNKLDSDLGEQVNYIENKSGMNAMDYIDEGTRVGDFDPKGYRNYDTKGINLPEKKADGGRIGYGVGNKVIGKGIPALLKKIQDKFGKNSIKVLENEPDYGLSVLNDYTIPRPESAIIRDKMKNFGKPGKFNDDGTIDYDYYAQAINDSENTFVYGDETIEELESMLQKNQEYMDDMYSQYKAEGGSKRLGGPNDPMKAAIDNASPGYTGDLKYDAQLVADDLAEKMYGVEYDDLTQAQQMDLYDKAYTALSKNQQGFKEMQKLSKPEKTLEGIKKTGVVDISNPDVAEEFTRFMKETAPEDYKNLEQKLQLENFNPKKTKGNAKGGRITYSSGGLAAMLGE